MTFFNKFTQQFKKPTSTAVELNPAQIAHNGEYPEVDVAIVMESTYPYLKGGVSAVVHDIVVENPDVEFGIIHIAWDSKAPHEDLYGMPANVKWVRMVYLSMEEHRHDFSSARVADLNMTSRERRELTDRLFGALKVLATTDPDKREVDALWELLDEGVLESTRRYPLWALLGSREFMMGVGRHLPELGLSLSEAFWTLRNFFSLAHAVLGETMPRAKVYHAHTTGYASLMSAAAAREHDTSFLLTEHNLYVRDTVNTLLGRNMALPLTSDDYRTFDVTAEQRAWMAWWTEMGHFCYPSAQVITYLYPSAIAEASLLGTDVNKSVVVPNGMVIEEFDRPYRARSQAMESIFANSHEHRWSLVYIARLVPIKGLLDLLESMAMLRDMGYPNVHLNVLGPTEHDPAYHQACVDKIAELDLADMVTIHGTVNVREHLHEYDLLVLPSYNEGQPIVVLEAMAAGIPTVGTDVGGMKQLIHDDLTTADGRVYEACGELVVAGDIKMMAEGIHRVVSNPELYKTYSVNSRERVQNFFQLHEVMANYNQLYRMLGDTAGERNARYDGASEVAHRRVDPITESLMVISAEQVESTTATGMEQARTAAADMPEVEPVHEGDQWMDLEAYLAAHRVESSEDSRTGGDRRRS
ncbi:GT4 family glycosyltransferase PelF [Kocuria sp.]|uniref:GT4 family glycosyltransferase PelF n=1 Tax=Kocuria sp. TaxID=1871328 RepID=UPI0026E066D0|nr:GT4 family glycosyltransferase PelF [Kocuria sp.]MDO5618861.1 GT4 family glycosyltransferase PelF [Kocuria sp.]